MQNNQFKSNARKHKALAIGFTLLFHVALFAMIGGDTAKMIDDYAPEFVKEWVKKDDAKKEQKNKQA